MSDRSDFTGKVALITGAAAGMGLAAAKMFVEAGAFIALADYKVDAVHEIVDQFTAAGHREIAIECDVSDEVQVRQMVERTVAEFGSLDVAFKQRRSHAARRSHC